MNQKVITVIQQDGAYYNFFNTPGSINSLQSMISDSWRVLHIKDDGYTATALFEKESGK